MHYKSMPLDDADVDMDSRIIRGYASTWDKDQVGDIIYAGAFRKTLSERARKIKVLRNHAGLIGKPVSAVEDGKGLLTESYIGKTRAGTETLELARDGILDSLSIGYSVPQGKSEYDAEGTRHIKEVKLYEWSFVDFAANEAAIITGVKTLHDAVEMGQKLDDESKQELAEMLDQLKALLAIGEPPKGTRQAVQPPEVEALMKSIQTFGR